MSLDVSDVLDLLETAIEKNEEAKAWQMWLAKYPDMNKKSFMPFSQFYKKAVSSEVNQQPTEDILKEVEAIRKKAGPQTG